MAKRGRDQVLVLFDVDGTLTKPRLKVEEDMLQKIKELRKHVTVGIVGGSDLKKQYEQLGETVLQDFDYVFSENGLQAFKDGNEIAVQSFKAHLGEERLKRFINFTLHRIADIDIPIKRGTFIEFRNGMLNVSPIGRNCAQDEREAFNDYDLEHKIRPTLIEAMKEEFKDDELLSQLRYSIGGQISFDVFPEGWDKTFCLQFVKEFDEVHFFGDKTAPGGNDHEIYESERTVGHCVTCPADTIKILDDLWLS